MRARGSGDIRLVRGGQDGEDSRAVIDGQLAASRPDTAGGTVHQNRPALDQSGAAELGEVSGQVVQRDRRPLVEGHGIRTGKTMPVSTATVSAKPPVTGMAATRSRVRTKPHAPCPFPTAETAGGTAPTSWCPSPPSDTGT